VTTLDDDTTALRDAIAVVHHGIERMPDSSAKARFSSELKALRQEMDRWENNPPTDEAHAVIHRRIVSLQLLVAKVQ
jgi:hypothetical protein